MAFFLNLKGILKQAESNQKDVYFKQLRVKFKQYKRFCEVFLVRYFFENKKFTFNNNFCMKMFKLNLGCDAPLVLLLDLIHISRNIYLNQSPITPAKGLGILIQSILSGHNVGLLQNDVGN